MTATSGSLTASLTAPTSVTLSTLRPSLTGGGTTQPDLLDHNGVSMRKAGKAPMGYNLGVFEYYSESEANTLVAALYADGVRILRPVGMNRKFGAPSKASGDSNRIFNPPGTDKGLTDMCFMRKNPKHLHKLDVFVNAVVKLSNAHPSDPMWVILGIEGDLRQSGTQDTAWNGTVFDPTTGTYDRALTLVQAGETIPGGAADWGLAGGYNVFTSKVMFGDARDEAKYLARRYRGTPWIFAMEFLSEPLPPSGAISTALNGRTLGAGSKYYIYPGPLNDGVYDSSWSTMAGRAGTGTISIEEYYRTLITDVIGDAATGKPAIASNMLFIVGGRNGYNLDPEAQEVLTALSDPSRLGGDLVGGNKIMPTWDRLGSGTNQCTKTPNTAWAIAKMKCVPFMNQLGCRNTGDGNKDVGDANTYGLKLAVRTYKAWGIPTTIWDLRGNGAGGYGSYASNGDGDGDGANGTYTVTSPRYSDLAGVFAETPASLEAAAISAATAANAVLVYVKADRSNCLDLSATAMNPSTAIGTAISKILPVTDPAGTGIFFTPHALGTVVLDLPWKDTSTTTYLPDKRCGIGFDNINDVAHNSMLDASLTYFAGASPSSTSATGLEDFTMIQAFQSTAGNGAAMVIADITNGSSSAHYPQIACNASNVMIAKVVTDSGPPTITAQNTSTWSLSAGVPIVATMIKGGASRTAATLTFLVNGIDDTAAVPGGYAGSAVAETLAGTANTLTGQAVGTAAGASVPRPRVGGSNSTGSFTGVMVGWCWARSAMTSAQYHAVGRWLAYLAGGGYKA